MEIQFTKQERLLAEQFQNYWSNLANNYNPNQGHSVNLNWNSYDNDERDILYFDVGNKMSIESGADREICDFWDSLNYDWLFSGL